MHVFHVNGVVGGCDLAEHRHAARQTVDISHREVDFSFLCSCQQMQNRVGRAAHGDVERHGVFKGREACNRTWQYVFIVLLIITASEIDNQMTSFHKQALAVSMGCERRAIAGQREAEGFGEAVHRVCCEHA